MPLIRPPLKETASKAYTKRFPGASPKWASVDLQFSNLHQNYFITVSGSIEVIAMAGTNSPRQLAMQKPKGSSERYFGKFDSARQAFRKEQATYVGLISQMMH